MRVTPYKLKVFRAKNGQWRWHLSRKGRIVAESGESYMRLAGCMGTIKKMDQDLLRDAGWDLEYNKYEASHVEKYLAKHWLARATVL